MSRWYRAYEGTVTDAKLAEAAVVADVSRAVSIAAWHCLLESAATVNNCGSYDTSARRVSIILCEPPAAVEALFAAYAELGLIGDGQILSWKKRQYQDKGDAPEGESGKPHVYFIGSDWRKSVKIGFSKNPWARVKEIQTGNSTKMELLAHFKCTETSEIRIHDLLCDMRHQGEWFDLPANITDLIQQASKSGATYEDLLRLLRSELRSPTSLIKAETETETEVLSSNEDRPSGDGPELKPEHVLEAYRELAAELGLPVPRDFTPERRQLVKARIAQYPLADFQEVFARCRGSPFLRGERTAKTPLTFDWLMQKRNFQKVLEGNYDR